MMLVHQVIFPQHVLHPQYILARCLCLSPVDVRDQLAESEEEAQGEGGE